MPYLQLHGLAFPDTRPQPSPMPHEILQCGKVSALVSCVPEHFRFDDLSPEEIIKWTIDHHEVLIPYCANTTVIPMTIGTVFSGESAILTQVSEGADQHLALLEKMRGIQEFSVQLRVVGKSVTRPAPAQSGRHFLKERRMMRDGRLNLHRDCHALSLSIIDELKTHAVHVNASGTPKKRDRLLDCVALVDTAKIAHLRRMTHELHDTAHALGLEFLITGPWPLYSCDAFMPQFLETPDAVGT